MTTIYQNSIFVQNELGSLNKILDIIKDAGIQIIASTISDTASDYGIYRVITPEPEKTFNVLKKEGVLVFMTEIFAVSLENETGAAAKVLSYFVEANVNIEYMYSFFMDSKGILILRTDDSKKADTVIKEKHLNCLSDKDLEKYK